MEVAINTLYSNRELYPFIPRHVFDALEAAYLEGKEIITIDEAALSSAALRLLLGGPMRRVYCRAGRCGAFTVGRADAVRLLLGGPMRRVYVGI